ncbi:acyltransferase [Streptomyces sp. MMBL 11-1]|uniref:acyltransferase n=1 Tax=Streptomyces sp. MMBL 11-1 TaxID=3026420 RepID=UPI002360B258|nr:acyltransferase [Streptomyces sp. MMBL 11-1]
METKGFPGVELRVGRARIGEGVRIGEGTVIVADQLVLKDGAVIGAGCDLRSAHLELGAGAHVGYGARWLVADAVRLGAGSVVDADSEVVCREWSVGEGCYLGHRLRVGAGASMEERSTLRIGDRCQIAPDVVVNPTEPVVIGDEVGISAQVAIWTHGYHAGHPVRDGHGAAFAGVEVQDGAWLGVRAMVLPGVRVGAGTVVAAMGLVNRSLPPGVLAAGVPARVKRALQPQALDVAGRREAVAVLVEDWMARLRFKGLMVEPAGLGEGGGWSVARAGARWEVALRTGPGQGPGVVEVRRAGAGAVFDFAEPLAVRGTLDELGHDLRDFLRRATWLFPYAGNSRGLVPERFARLLD